MKRSFSKRDSNSSLRAHVFAGPSGEIVLSTRAWLGATGGVRAPTPFEWRCIRHTDEHCFLAVKQT